MIHQIPITGRIVSYAGASPGPASGITYTASVNTPDGVVTMPGVVPSGWRWPDVLPVNAAAMVGTMIQGVLVESRAFWFFVEAPAIDLCNGGA